MSRFGYFLLLGLMAQGAFLGCGGAEVGAAIPAPNAAPPPCTPSEAPFGKVMNPGTVGDFNSCTITTQVEFNSPDWGGMVGGDIEGYVKWSANLPGAAPSAPAGPFGALDFKMMYVAKTKSDAMFKLKKGDRVNVKGVALTNAARQVVFFAFDVLPSAAK